MEQREINPWTWQEHFGFSQAVQVEGARKMLFISGQAAIDAQGQVAHAGDMAGQVKMTLDHLETVLAQAGSSTRDVVKAVVYTTDVDALLAQWGQIKDRLRLPGGPFASTLVGVTRLAMPELMVEIEAIAVQ